MDIKLQPIARVRNNREKTVDDFWGTIISEIELEEQIPEEAFTGITSFSQLEIIYYFNKAEEENILFSRRPRGNPDFPEMGIFSQRNKDRPNHIGLCTVELIWHRGRSIGVKYLDAIDGTPVLDIKPVYKEFRPETEIRQPKWVSDLMKNYWEEGKK
ncbi:MAG TPA: SAM-dependent methyltransferase [Puia sp.]